MNLPLNLTLTFAIAITGCGQSTAPSPSYKAPKTSASQEAAATAKHGDTLAGSDSILNSLPDTPEGKADLLKSLEARNSAEIRELNLLKKTNEKFCLRLDKLRSECAAAVRLITESSEKILGCDSAYSENTTVRHKFKIDISGIDNQFAIIADKTFSTNLFGSGASALEFKSTANNDVAAPRLLDVTNIRLAPNSGSLPDIKSIQFKFVVDETTLFTQANLMKSSEGNFFNINPAAIEEIRRSTACNVTDSELDAMVEQARQEAGSVDK